MNGMRPVNYDNFNNPNVWQDGNNCLYAKDNSGNLIEIDQNGNPIKRQQGMYQNTQQYTQQQNNNGLTPIRKNNMGNPDVWQDGQGNLYMHDNIQFYQIDQNGNPIQQPGMRQNIGNVNPMYNNNNMQQQPMGVQIGNTSGVTIPGLNSSGNPFNPQGNSSEIFINGPTSELGSTRKSIHPEKTNRNSVQPMAETITPIMDTPAVINLAEYSDDTGLPLLPYIGNQNESLELVVNDQNKTYRILKIKG